MIRSLRQAVLRSVSPISRGVAKRRYGAILGIRRAPQYRPSAPMAVVPAIPPTTPAWTPSAEQIVEEVSRATGGEGLFTKYWRWSPHDARSRRIARG